jgi:beta-lactam-binding protein with PASTA domain
MNKRSGWIVCLALLGGCPAMTTTKSASTTPQPPSGDDRASGASTATNVMVPDVMGKSKDEAEAIFAQAGLKASLDNDPNGKVCSQTPGGGHEQANSLPVVIRFCNDDKVPEKYTTKLEGLTVDDAKKKAVAAGFTGRIEVVEALNASCKPGTVCSVSPERWELNQDHVMQLYTPKKLDVRMPD